jgi:hypothetical protein
MPIPPKGAQYTLFCQRIVGPDHYERSRALRKALHDSTPMKDWYVVHSGDYSTLYYGFYRTIDRRDPVDGKEGQRAINDLDAIRAMTDANGMRPFSASLPARIDSPDPSANPAWDLSRTDGYWSLQIAAYKDSPDRKEAAVESVRAARAQGIEAYYYHGPTISSVCIGSWPREAAREIDVAQQNVNPDAPVVVTAKPMSPNLAKQYNERGITTAAPEVVPVDPTLLEAMRRFPDEAINGQVMAHRMKDPTTGVEKLVPDRSFLVKISHQDVSDDETMPRAGEGAPAGVPMEKPDERPGMGRLKSLGD